MHVVRTAPSLYLRGQNAACVGVTVGVNLMHPDETTHFEGRRLGSLDEQACLGPAFPALGNQGTGRFRRLP